MNREREKAGEYDNTELNIKCTLTSWCKCRTSKPMQIKSVQILLSIKHNIKDIDIIKQRKGFLHFGGITQKTNHFTAATCTSSIRLS